MYYARDKREIRARCLVEAKQKRALEIAAKIESKGYEIGDVCREVEQLLQKLFDEMEHVVQEYQLWHQWGYAMWLLQEGGLHLSKHRKDHFMRIVRMPTEISALYDMQPQEKQIPVMCVRAEEEVPKQKHLLERFTSSLARSGA